MDDAASVLDRQDSCRMCSPTTCCVDAAKPSRVRHYNTGTHDLSLPGMSLAQGMPVTTPAIAQRMADAVRRWGVAVEHTLETPTSILTFGTQGHLPVVVKVLHTLGDEWHCGEVLSAFDGRGMVRAYAYAGGAVLLERLAPGTPLVGLSLGGRDDEATAILAELIGRIPHPPVSRIAAPTVEDWGKGFAKYLAMNDSQIAAELVERARHMYASLSATQTHVGLLHGDLHHYNVLFDASRGWTAVDPKGVAGEREYELGASLRNPNESSLFASTRAVERRVRGFQATLTIDADRVLRWAFAQAVLASIWTIEDGGTIAPDNSTIALAEAIWPLIA
jgi:streptomycin 6-kinase